MDFWLVVGAFTILAVGALLSTQLCLQEILWDAEISEGSELH